MKLSILFILIFIIFTNYVFVGTVFSNSGKTIEQDVENSKIDDLKNVIEQLRKVDQYDVDQLLYEINKRDQIDAIKYIRKRGDEAEVSAINLFKEGRVVETLYTQQHPENPIVNYAYAYLLSTAGNRRESTKILQGILKKILICHICII